MLFSHLGVPNFTIFYLLSALRGPRHPWSGFNIATGAFFLYALFHQTGDNDIQSCINSSTDDLKKQACQKGFEVIRGVIVGTFVVIWLIELCAYLTPQLLTCL
jgi:hypothetical protein